MLRSISLNGTWDLRWRDGQRGQAREGILQPEADMSRALPARVPGEVHLDLMAAGLLEDPAIGLNCLRARWVEETIWIYRRVFTASALAPGERAWLVFRQLDLAAVVLLNGKQIASHANVFHPLRVDVTAALQAGENVLVVELESGLFSVSERPWQGYGNGPDGRLHKRHWLRKPQSSFSWDWSQRLVNVGISGDVSLEIAAGARCDRLVAVTRLSDDLRHGTATVRLFMDGLDDTRRQGRLLVTVEGASGTAGSSRSDVEIGPGRQCLEAVVEVPAPELWWPRGHGAQPLYTVHAVLTVEEDVVAEDSRRVGFRHVRINQDRHPDQGRWFVLEINGRPIFCKGGNFVPADMIFARLDRSRYSTLIDRAEEANFNLLRIWGGGLYESDDFYEICDERGFLVWQEFIFACSKYPTTDAGFLADVRQEATHQVRRLAHHPSLVIWCGNNELEWGAHSWGYDQGVALPDHALFHLVLPRIVDQEDGTRYYHPSSPYSPDRELPNADYTGDQHPWSVGFANTDFRDYRDMACRFPNEGGIMGPTALPTVRACLEGDDGIGSFAWEVHENSIAFSAGTDRMLQQWLGLRAGDLSVDEWVYRGGLLQGLGLNEYIRNFRRRMFDTAAAIFWMYNDCWPMVRSWTIVDYYLRRTPAFHPVRRAFAPVTVALALEDESVRVYGINEGPAMEGELRYGLLALAGEYPLDRRVPVSLPANSSTVLGEFPVSEWHQLGDRAHVAFALLKRDGREVSHEVLFLPLYREMTWPTAQVEVEQRPRKAVFHSRTFAWRVCLGLDGERRLPDNFFDLLPGVEYELDWPAELGLPQILAVGNLV